MRRIEQHVLLKPDATLAELLERIPVKVVSPEPVHVVEIKDGRITMWMRTYCEFVARAYSDDKGQSWSPGEMVKELTLPPNSSALVTV